MADCISEDQSSMTKLKRMFVSESEAPELAKDEETLRKGAVVLAKGLFFARVGRLILTNQRLMWYEPKPPWPMKPLACQIDLRDIVNVDKGTLLDFIGGGTPLRLRLRNNRSKCLWDNENKLDEWIVAIREAAAQVHSDASASVTS